MFLKRYKDHAIGSIRELHINRTFSCNPVADLKISLAFWKIGELGRLHASALYILP